MNKQDMINSVKMYLSQFGRVDEAVLVAMKKVDRAIFYPFGEKAYEDTAKPIQKGQTISQPSCVGRMLSLLELRRGDYVLEVGAGSGWLASLLSEIVRPGKVLSLDFHDELVEVARKNSADFGLDENLEIENQDFWELIEKFDKIIFSCGISQDEEEKVEDWMVNHLKENGRAVVPFRKGPLIIFVKRHGVLKKRYSEEEYSFVPLFS